MAKTKDEPDYTVPGMAALEAAIATDLAKLLTTVKLFGRDRVELIRFVKLASGTAYKKGCLDERQGRAMSAEETNNYLDKMWRKVFDPDSREAEGSGDSKA